MDTSLSGLRQELKSCRKDSQIFPPDPHAGIPMCALGDSYLCRCLGFWVPGYIDLLGLRAFRLHTAFRLQGLSSLVCEASRARICRPAHESALSMRDSKVSVIVRCHVCVCLFASKTTWKAYDQAHGWQLHSSRDMPVRCSYRCLAMLPRSQLFTRQSRRRTMDFPQNSFEYWDVLQAPAHQPHLGWAIVELSGGLPTCYMHGVVRSQVSIRGGLIESSQRLLWLHLHQFAPERELADSLLQELRASTSLSSKCTAGQRAFSFRFISAWRLSRSCNLVGHSRKSRTDGQDLAHADTRRQRSGTRRQQSEKSFGISCPESSLQEAGLRHRVRIRWQPQVRFKTSSSNIMADFAAL